MKTIAPLERARCGCIRRRAVRQRARRRAVAAVGALGVLFGLAAGPALAQSKSVERGRLLAQRDCAMCHAIGADDESVNPDAPPLRNLSLHLSPDTLSQLLATGMLSGHPRMPDFRLTEGDYADLVHYLDQLQGPPPPASPGAPP